MKFLLRAAAAAMAVALSSSAFADFADWKKIADPAKSESLNFYMGSAGKVISVLTVANVDLSNAAAAEEAASGIAAEMKAYKGSCDKLEKSPEGPYVLKCRQMQKDKEIQSTVYFVKGKEVSVMAGCYGGADFQDIMEILEGEGFVESAEKNSEKTPAEGSIASGKDDIPDSAGSVADDEPVKSE